MQLKIELLADLVNDEQKYEHANDLILAIKRKMAGVKELTIFAAGYPQTHPEATSFELDLMYLEKKAGTWFDSIDIY